MKSLICHSLALLATLVCSSALASSYYASLTTKVADGCANMGQVYASTSGTESSSSYSPEGNGAVQSSSTSTSGGNVTMYAYAKANEGYQFLGWATSSSGATSYASTATKYTLSLKASTTKSGVQPYTYYAYFQELTYDPFSITFVAPPEGTSYTVNGEAPADLTGLTKVTKVTLATSDSSFNSWKINGSRVDTNPYTFSATANTTVEAEFMTADKVATVTTKAELVAALANTEQYLKVQVAPNATITIPQGEKVTVPDGMNLTVDGQLLLEGELANGGKVTGSGQITAFAKLVTQACASGDTPFETTCVVASYNKKYYKTSVSDLSGKVSGTAPGCTVQNGARVVRNGAVIAQCAWPSSVTPAVLCCTVDPAKAVNHITGFLDPCYDADAAKGMATMKANGQQTKQMLVLLATKTLNNSACSSGGLLVKIGSYDKMQGNFGTMDLAGSTLTISPSYIDNYTHTLLNGVLSVTTLMYSGTLNCINLSSLSLSKLKEDYASVVNIYDCKLGSTKVPVKYNGTNANKNKVNFYSSGDNVYSTSSNFNSQNQTTVYKIYGGRWSAKPAADYNGAGSDYGFYQTSDTDTSYSLQLKTDKTVVTFDDGSEFDALADAFAALSSLASSSVKMTMVRNATLANAVTVPAGKTVEIELDGCCITAQNGFVVNNGTFLIGDRRGNIASDGGRVVVSSGKLLQNNGTAEITYGYYTGDVVLNGGELTTHYGRFTGNFTAATGVDKTAVANFRGGYFDKDVSSFLRAGYIRMSGYVGTFPQPVVTRSWVSSNGGYYKYNAKLLSTADNAIYTTSATTKEGFTLANWKRRGEILSMVTPYFFNTIDTAVGFDRATTKSGVYANVTKPSIVGNNEMTEDVEAGGLFRILSPQLANPTNPLLKPSSQKKYTDALTDDTYKEMEFGIYSSKAVDQGTTVNLRIDLCTGSSGTDITNLRSVYALMSEYAVIGAGQTNQAMIQPVSGAATFYATLAAAIAACPEGGTVKLCNDVTSTAAVVVAKKSVTIDTNGFAFGGTVVPGKYCTMTESDATPEIDQPLGKVRKVFAVTYTNPGFAITIE